MSFRYALAALLLAVIAPVSRGELVVEEEAGGQQGLTVFKMTVTPAGESEPALKHRLVPGPLDLRPGNAALFYCRSFAEGSLSSAWKAVEKEFTYDEIHGSDQVDGWYDVSRPLDSIPLDKLREASARFDTIMKQFVERGAERAECNWGHYIQEVRGTDIIATLLPEIQECRSLGRAVGLRTRLAIAERDFPRAIEHLRINYRLGKHVSEAPFLVSGLVAIAIANTANAGVVELIATEGSPNLYWALAEMPRPYIDLQPSVRFEMSLGPRMFPFMMEPEKKRYSTEEWARVLSESLQETSKVASGTPHWNELGAQLAATGLALLTYPAAKERLVEDGMDRDAVEAMPVGQVIAIDAARGYQQLADEFEKWWYTPFPVALEGSKLADLKLSRINKFEGGLGEILASMLLPALNAARNAQVRLDWQLNALQTLEAIRMHAAETGKLPASLDEIDVVPVPTSPLTGKPYDYRLEGDTAVLELPKNDLIRDFAWRFEIKLAKE
ncbi:MAG TPA: hypothetical protein VF175_16000 [Lacipirellula sp.]